MPLQPVVVAHRFLYRAFVMGFSNKACCHLLLVCLYFVTSVSLAAEETTKTSNPITPAILDVNNPAVFHGRLANIQNHSLEELTQLLDRAGASLEAVDDFPAGNAIIFILHGPEVRFFEKANFSRYRALVEKAAQLEAFDVIDVQVCERYLREHGISRSQMPAFINIVPNGPLEEARLLEREGYVHF